MPVHRALSEERQAFCLRCRAWRAWRAAQKAGGYACPPFGLCRRRAPAPNGANFSSLWDVLTRRCFNGAIAHLAEMSEGGTGFQPVSCGSHSQDGCATLMTKGRETGLPHCAGACCHGRHPACVPPRLPAFRRGYSPRRGRAVFRGNTTPSRGPRSATHQRPRRCRHRRSCKKPCADPQTRGCPSRR